MNYFF